LSQEAVLALLLPTACRLAVGPRVMSAAASPYWVLQTLATCLLLFPAVDPLLHSAWQPVAEVRPSVCSHHEITMRLHLVQTSMRGCISQPCNHLALQSNGNRTWPAVTASCQAPLLCRPQLVGHLGHLIPSC
jgi:hypothetical protein